MPKITEIPLATLMAVVPKLSTGYADDPVTYNLNVEQWESQKELIPRPDWFMKFDAAGKAECGEGHIDDPEAIIFNIKQADPYKTLAGLFVHGLNDGSPYCAQMSMMMGKIGIPMEKIKQVQSFFKRLEIGFEPTQKALAEAGVTVEDE